jgi:hypothetical protein
MQWDGSFIGSIKNSNILQKIKYNSDVFWNLQINSINFWCIARSCKTLYPIIIDKLKPLFNIEMNKLHYCIRGKTIYILYSVPSNSEYAALAELKLNKIKYNDFEFDNRLRKILAFRELLGLKFSTPTSIRIRFDFTNSNQTGELKDWNPISFRETDFVFDKMALGKGIFKKLFNNDYEILENRIRELLVSNNINDLNGLLNSMEQIIYSIDKSYLWILNEFSKRMNRFF